MLYRFLKIWARLALLLFCRKITIRNKELLDTAQPLIIAANHPNSFLDAIIIDCIFDQPVHALARGDAFANSFLRRLFRSLCMLPIYRSSEGRDNLPANYQTFEQCKKILASDGTVLLFSEGKCINEWHLRPLMKGTARLAVQCWAAGIPARVLPIGLNYHSFQAFGKEIIIQPANPFGSEVIGSSPSEGTSYLAFNNILSERLREGVYEIEQTDIVTRKQVFKRTMPFWKKILLFIPGLAGWILHQPLYFPIRKMVARACSNNDHYDSALFGALMLLYPLYLLLIGGLTGYYTNWMIGLFVFLGMPFLAWCRTRSRLKFS